MAAVTGLTTIKSFTYRDKTDEEWSSKYHFKGPPPGDDASWMVLLTDLVNKELPMLYSDTTVVRAYGYDSDDPHAAHVFVHDYALAGTPPSGTLVPGGSQRMAGDQACLMEWRMNRLNSKGKNIYLRKYFHGGFIKAGDGDQVDDLQYGAMQVFVGNGGVNSIHGGLRSQRIDDTVVQGLASHWVTTRTLKRRGKRPR